MDDTMHSLDEYKISWDFDQDKGIIVNIPYILKKIGIPSTYIEIGVFEGHTLFLLSKALEDKIKIYAIDPHIGSNDMSDDFASVKNNFLYNLNICTNKNILHIDDYSKNGLVKLINDKIKAELIYIDGDHKASEVLTDLVLAWECLSVGGVILCDDTGTWKYTDKNNVAGAQYSPRMAVEMFIQCNWHKIEILDLPDGNQTAFVKLME